MLDPLSPLGAGMTPFGFSIPQGHPGSIEAAARGCRSLAASMREQAGALRAASAVALETDGSWRGSAASAFSEYSGHVESVYHANAGLCEEVAGDLSKLADALTQAQSITRKALADCEQYHTEMVTQQGNAATAAQQANAATQQMSSPMVHPAAIPALQHQVTLAQHAQTAANDAATRAGNDLAAAEKQGKDAADAYEKIASQVSSRLIGATGQIRQASVLAGGAAVPITVTPSDISLAESMMAAAPALATAASALRDPAELERLAGGRRITPAVALEFIQEYQNRLQLAKIAASDKPLDGSIAGVVPGPPGQVLEGGWKEIKGTAQLVWSGVSNPTSVPGAVGHYVSWAVNNPVAWAKTVIDYNDWSHGRGWQASGEILVVVVAAKAGGVDNAAAAGGRGAASTVSTTVQFLKENPDWRPWTTENGGHLADVLGVPHAGDVSKAVAPLTSNTPTQLGAGARVAPSQAVGWAKSLPGAAKAKVVAVVKAVSTAIYDPAPISAQLQKGLAELPPQARIIVVQNAPSKVIERPPAPATIVRRYPRGR